MHQWTNWEAVFSTWSVQQLRDATIEELLKKLFSVRSIPRCYEKDKCRINLVARQSPISKDLNTEAEEATAM
jgi:hypothetical protein